MKGLSLAAFILLVAAVSYLAYHRALLGTGPISIGIQALAVVLMIWARFTLGVRSFHATANPTEGELVTSGPYRFIRHPIYAAVAYFLAAALSVHPSIPNGIATVTAFVGIALRIMAEEKLLRAQYPAYAEYSRRAKRVVPFLL